MDNNKNIRAHHIFIDYENVQPSSFVFPQDFPFKVFLFVGANQTKIPIELVTSMQTLGENAEYVIIEGKGKNALDFHITFYLGKFFEKDTTGRFYIISKDAGFDILIKHLRNKKVLIQRHHQISDIPLLKIHNSKSLEERTEVIKNHLASRGNAKPKKVETLSNTINTLFINSLNSEEIDKLVNELVRRKLVTIQGTQVHYNL